VCSELTELESVTVDNVQQADECLGKVGDMMEDIGADVQHDINMQIMGATNPLGWAAVVGAEIDRGEEPVSTLSRAAVRKIVKETMSYEKDLAAAVKARSGKRTRVAAPEEDEEESSKPVLSARRPTGGKFGKGRRPVECFRCGVEGHVVQNCTKPA